MKELSIEEKAKAYDEVREKIAIRFGSNVADEIFSQFEMSKDEKIKREITDILRNAYWTSNRDRFNELVAWLEKKGKQKPTDKAEPKFKVGDWVVTPKNQVYQITSIEGTSYRFNNESTYWEICYCDKQCHLWTIEDTKKGDVLEFGDHGRLVVGIVSYVNKTTGKVDVNCLLENNNFKVGNYYNLDTIKPHPATQEQRNLLFQKMKEDGYEWDAEKKELKKIEQKPDYSEEDKQYFNFLEKLLGNLQVKSTENEIKKGTDSNSEYYYKVIQWLKSLRPQKQNITSKEFEDAIREIKTRIAQCNGFNRKHREEVFSLLDSLRPQSTWKPSDEQMEALESATENCAYSEYQDCLRELIGQLKKLKEL